MLGDVRLIRHFWTFKNHIKFAETQKYKLRYFLSSYTQQNFPGFYVPEYWVEDRLFREVAATKLGREKGKGKEQKNSVSGIEEHIQTLEKGKEKNNKPVKRILNHRRKEKERNNKLMFLVLKRISKQRRRERERNNKLVKRISKHRRRDL
jgi:hypothetical protein